VGVSISVSIRSSTVRGFPRFLGNMSIVMSTSQSALMRYVLSHLRDKECGRLRRAVSIRSNAVRGFSLFNAYEQAYYASMSQSALMRYVVSHAALAVAMAGLWSQSALMRYVVSHPIRKESEMADSKGLNPL